MVAKLKEKCGEVRKAVRGILHLPPGTPPAWYYMRASDGGIAMPSVTQCMGFARLRRLLRKRRQARGFLRESLR